MIRIALLAAAIATATSAAAQNYPSSLPLTAAERRALEMQLSTILDFTPEGRVARFALPGGGQAAVRAYRMVRSRKGEACRGYRIDVDGQAGRSAVDGYRCRLLDGRAWVITEPETLIAQGGTDGAGNGASPGGSGPLDLRGNTAPSPDTPADDELSRDPDGFAARLRERLEQPGEQVRYPDEQVPFDAEGYALRERVAGEEGEERLGDRLFAPGEVPPVPRQPPQRVARADDDGLTDPLPPEPEPDFGDAMDAGDDPDSLDVDTAAAARPGAAQDAAPRINARPVTGATPATDAPSGVTTARTEPATSTPPAPPAAAPPAPPAAPPAAAADPAPVEAPPAQAAPDGARIVGSRTEDEPQQQQTSTTDARVVAALKELDYLPPGATAAEAEIEAAIDDFARDERFALPVPPTSLLERLNAALDRSGSLPVCTSNAQTMCIAP